MASRGTSAPGKYGRYEARYLKSILFIASLIHKAPSRERTMAFKNTKNQAGKIFILGIEGEEIFYSASNHEIVSRLKPACPQIPTTAPTTKTVSAKAKPHSGGTGITP